MKVPNCCAVNFVIIYNASQIIYLLFIKKKCYYGNLLSPSYKDRLNARKNINQISLELNKSHPAILKNKIYYKPNKYNNYSNDKTKRLLL